jgi:hypothetical protein
VGDGEGAAAGTARNHRGRGGQQVNALLRQRTVGRHYPGHQTRARSPDHADALQTPGPRDDSGHANAHARNKHAKKYAEAEKLADEEAEKIEENWERVLLHSPRETQKSKERQITNEATDRSLLGEFRPALVLPSLVKGSGEEPRTARKTKRPAGVRPNTHHPVASETTMTALLKASAQAAAKYLHRGPEQQSAQAKYLDDAGPSPAQAKYLERCETQKMIAETVTIDEDPANGHRSVDKSHMALGDRQAKTMCHLLEDIDSLNLKGNHITDKGMEHIIRHLDVRRVKQLDLGCNPLSKTIRATGFIPELTSLILESSVLQYLSLAGTNVGDDAVLKIAHALSNSPSVTRVSLRRCGIRGKQTASMVAVMMQRAGLLHTLDLSWNMLTGESAAAVASALECGEVASNLKTLDLSFNAFGSETGADAVGPLARALAQNKYLTHLNLSGNNFTPAAVQTLGKALDSNHTLLGLHIDGECTQVDGCGVLRGHQRKKEDAVIHSASNHFIGHHHDRSIVHSCQEPSKFQLQLQQNNCWLCQGWREKLFKIQLPAGVGDPKQVLKSTVHLRCSFNGWQRVVMFGHKVTGSACFFEVSVVVPQWPYYFCFETASGGQGVVQVTDASIPTAPTPYDKATYGFAAAEDQGVEQIIPFVNFRADDDDDDQKDLDCDFDFEASMPPLFHCKPRLKPTAEPQNVKWSLPVSVFADYCNDTHKLMAAAFDFDWNLASAGLKSHKDDLRGIAHVMENHFQVLKDAFKYYSSTSMEKYTMAWNAFTDFTNRTQIPDKEGCGTTNIDMIFIACNMTGPKCKSNPQRSLLRFQFLQAVIQLAIAKYYKKETKDSFSKADAVNKLLTDNIVPFAERGQGESFRKTRLWNEPCDTLYKAAMADLKRIFKMYSELEHKPLTDKYKYLNVSEWMKLCEHVNLVDKVFTVREVKLAYILAQQTEENEFTHQDHQQLSWVEFIEAIARVADIKDFRLVGSSHGPGEGHLSVNLKFAIETFKYVLTPEFKATGLLKVKATKK